MFWSEKPFTDRISYRASVKLAYSYVFLKIANKILSKIGFELAFTGTFATMTVAASRPIAVLAAAMGNSSYVLFRDLFGGCMGGIQVEK